MITVLHNSNLHLRRRGHRPPPTPRRLTLHRPRPIQTNRHPTIPPNQIIRPPSPRPLPFNTSNPQLLPLLHDWSSLRTTHLHHPSRKPGQTGALRRLESGTGVAESPFSAGCSLGCLLVYRCFCGGGYDSSCVWVGCLGDVDAGGCVVCLVAGLVDWVYPVGIVDVLIICIQYLPPPDILVDRRSIYNCRSQCRNRPFIHYR